VTRATRPSCVLVEVFISGPFCLQLRFQWPAKTGQAWNPASLIARRIISRAFAARQLGLHELDIESDGDPVTYENAAGLEGGVPSQTKVLTIDLCDRGDRNPSVAPRILRRRRGPFDRKADLAGNTVDGQVALDRQFSIPDDADARGFEMQGREFLDIKEISTFRCASRCSSRV